MTQRTALTQLLADPKSAAPAVITESPPAVLTYRTLAEQIERLAEQLRSAGLRPGDCVAMVLPNGLEFLVVFLAIAEAGRIAAPLNPAYKTDELRIFSEITRTRIRFAIQRVCISVANSASSPPSSATSTIRENLGSNPAR